MRRLNRVVVSSVPNAAGALSVVDVRDQECTLSTGEILLIRYAKLRVLAEQVCQERCPVWIRTWITPAGNELIELRRELMADPGATTPSRFTGTDEVF